jgi:hypothetical protein
MHTLYVNEYAPRRQSASLLMYIVAQGLGTAYSSQAKSSHDCQSIGDLTGS